MAEQEARKMDAEIASLIATSIKLNAETEKLHAEAQKLGAERGLMERRRFITPWQTVLLAVAAGAGLYAALLRIIGA